MSENVHDYPRPPLWERCDKHIVVRFNRETIADTRRSIRVLETTHPPNFYIPLEDVNRAYVQESDRSTFCEWKGDAAYFTVKVGGRAAENAAWYYPEPTAEFEILRDHVAFYVGPMDECLVDGEAATPEEPSFYGGWVTNDIELSRSTLVDR